MSRLEVALNYARRGWPVFPLYQSGQKGLCNCGDPKCQSPAKHPRIRHGVLEATTNEARIQQWWTQWREANIGIATGQASGIVVVDVDVKNGARGRESLASLKGLEPTLTVTTPSGGWHLYYLCPEGGIRCRNGMLPGIDFKADGGYVVASGSSIDGKDYEWLDAEAPVSVLPEVVKDVMANGNGAHLNGTVPQVPEIIPKTKRNATLTSVAGTLRRRGLTAPEILPSLNAVNKRCKEPLPASEVQRIAQGIQRYPPAAPWLKDKTFLPAVLAKEIARQNHFLTSPIDDAGVGVRLHVYEGGVFRLNGADIARKLTHELLGTASKPDRLISTFELMKESSKVVASDLNPKAMDLLNIQNGMLDWRTGELKPHSPDYHSTFQIAARYVPSERSETLDRFLAEVFPQDALILAEELVGYLLRPTTKFQKAFMLLGDGANGKSTFLSMLTAFLGADCVSNVSLQDLVENRFKLAELLGKLVNIYADIPSSSLEQSDIFKAVVAGDTVTPERKFGHPFKMVPTARLLFSANDLPRSRDLSPAYFRRWVIVPFPNRFEGPKAKKDLLGLLTTPEAGSALLNRAVDGLRRLEGQQEFTACRSVQEAGQSYRRQCDSAFEFISERLEATPDSVVGKAEVYATYKEWATEAGMPHPVNQRAFNKRLSEVLGVAEKRVARAGSFQRVWAGLSLKAEPIA